MANNSRVNTERELARLTAYDRHFLDANLLIGYSVEWDSLNPASAYYFRAGSPKYLTSVRVHEEARRVVEACRRRILQVADRVATDFSIGQEFRIVDDLHGFIDQQFSDLKSPVKGYVSHREDLFRQLAHSPPEHVQDEIRTEISDDFQTPLVFLTKIKASDGPVALWTRAPENHESVYPHKYDTLSAEMSNTDDRDLLLDAYDYIQNNRCSELLVATLDRTDFIEDRDDIEAALETIKILDALGLYRTQADE